MRRRLLALLLTLALLIPQLAACTGDGDTDPASSGETNATVVQDDAEGGEDDGDAEESPEAEPTEGEAGGDTDEGVEAQVTEEAP